MNNQVLAESFFLLVNTEKRINGLKYNIMAGVETNVSIYFKPNQALFPETY
jgi:hypothetical protein